MKAVRLVQLGKPLEEVEMALPEIRPDDVLVRVAACGICHSDAHYRAGVSQIASLPVTPGHEIAGRVEAVGRAVQHLKAGDRVCVHYLVTCGCCEFCAGGKEQFCPSVQMLGKHRDGGYGEFVRVPGRNAFVLPDDIPFEVGAIMMCSSATALHALHKARLGRGESIAIFGFGGLGFSALQLAQALGCGAAYVVEINSAKLEAAADFGAVTIDARTNDPVKEIRDATHGKGVDVSLELIGSAVTMAQATQCLAVQGRAAVAGLTNEMLYIRPYTELINKEAEIIGVSDHLASDIPALIEFGQRGQLRFPTGSVRRVALRAPEINKVLDDLEKGTSQIRTVIVSAVSGSPGR